LSTDKGLDEVSRGLMHKKKKKTKKTRGMFLKKEDLVLRAASEMQLTGTGYMAKQGSKKKVCKTPKW